VLFAAACEEADGGAGDPVLPHRRDQRLGHARNSGEASAARLLGIGSGAAVAAPAAGVPAGAGLALGEAMGVTWAAIRRIGATATASAGLPGQRQTRRRENRAERDGTGVMGDPSVVARRAFRAKPDAHPGMGRHDSTRDRAAYGAGVAVAATGSKV
jgi:hypothetical protein